jgi:hypothetical protein
VAPIVPPMTGVAQLPRETIVADPQAMGGGA